MDGLLNVLYMSAEESAIFGVIAVLFVLFIILLFMVGITALVLGIIGQWKMFEKAGENGWKSLIPVYNLYTMCKVIGVNPWWILVSFVVSIVYTVFSGVAGVYDDAWVLMIFVVLFGLLNLAVSIYFKIILAGSTAKSYGKDTGWAVGLYFLRPFFMFALGIGKSEYVGVTPMNDPILGNKGKTTTGKASGKFCPECGASVDAKAKFCPECGKKL